MSHQEEITRSAGIVGVITVLILVSLIGVSFSPFIIKLFASGFKGEIFNLAVNLNRIMFPYILFASLTALSMGVLNSLKHFFAPAFSPVIFNIVVIGTVLLIQQNFDLPIFSLAIGVIIGGIIQILFQIPFLRNRGFLYQFRKNLRHPAVKQIALLMAPQLFGVAVYNLNILVSTQYASNLPEGTVSYLYYSERLIEFPLGIVAVSIATALLPNLSSQALLGYAVGLWAVGGVRITAPTFYAIQDTKSPVKIAFLAFIVNALFGYILGFTFGLKHMGLALASLISSTFNFSLLLFTLSKRMGEIEIKKTLIQVLKITVASLIMGVSAWKISAFYDWSQSGISLEKIGVFLASVLVSVALYFTIAKLLKVEEIGFLFDMIKRKARM